MTIGHVTVIPQYSNVMAIMVREIGKPDRSHVLPRGTNELTATKIVDTVCSFPQDQAYTFMTVGPKTSGVLLVLQVPKKGESWTCDWDAADKALNQWAKEVESQIDSVPELVNLQA